jgi:hypothetical protein
MVACLIVATTAVAACGDDDAEPERSAGDRGTTPFVSLSEAESVVDARLPVMWSGRGSAGIADEVQPAPIDSVRYATQSGREFDVLVFESPAAARAARPSIQRTEVIEEGGATTRAANVVAVFPRPPGQRGAFRVAWDELRRLGDACVDRDQADADLRRLCFSDDGVPPAGEGVDEDVVAPVGATVTVDGLEYSVETARQLNPSIVPDRDLLDRRRPGQGRTFFGVFVRVCNEDGATATPSDRLSVVDAFGKEVRPVELPAGNPFAYEPEALPAGACLPEPGSAAERTTDGALVLYDVPLDFLGERPLALQVRGESGERAQVQVDL